jgi:DNA-binding FadR family transcriptional regulator
VTASQGPDNFTAPASWPKRPARLGTAVVDVLVDRIVAGELEPGTLLPTEPRLSEVFGVSRTVIREAVKNLEQKGLVRARQGQGTRVALPDDWNLLDLMVLAGTATRPWRRPISSSRSSRNVASRRGSRKAR